MIPSLLHFCLGKLTHRFYWTDHPSWCSPDIGSFALGFLRCSHRVTGDPACFSGEAEENK